MCFLTSHRLRFFLVAACSSRIAFLDLRLYRLRRGPQHSPSPSPIPLLPCACIDQQAMVSNRNRFTAFVSYSTRCLGHSPRLLLLPPPSRPSTLAPPPSPGTTRTPRPWSWPTAAARFPSCTRARSRLTTNSVDIVSASTPNGALSFFFITITVHIQKSYSILSLPRDSPPVQS